MEECYICHNDPGVRSFCSRPHIHKLKIWTDPFEAVLNGEKRYEVRKTDDRKFFVGDFITLQEYVARTEVYTGREVFAQITYVTEAGSWGLPNNLCVFGFEVMKNGKRQTA